MRKLIAACFMVASSALSSAQTVRLADLTWLAGDWQFSSGNRVLEEHWTSPSTNMLLGMSRTVRDGSTIGFEFVRIEKRDAELFYVAQPSGRPPTDFKFASGSAT